MCDNQVTADRWPGRQAGGDRVAIMSSEVTNHLSMCQVLATCIKVRHFHAQRSVSINYQHCPKSLTLLVSFGTFFAQLYAYQTTNPSKKYKILDNSCKELTKINDAMWTVRICLKNDLHSWRRCIFVLTVQLWGGTCSRCVLLHWTQNMKPGLILRPFTSLDATLMLVLIGHMTGLLQFYFARFCASVMG